VLLWFGILGGVDDWLKLTAASRQRGRNGLLAWEKLIFQIAGAVLIASFLFFDFGEIDDGKRFWVPFYKYGLPLANWTFILVAIFYISMTSNAVNLADGMDGLAGGCVAMVSLVLVVLCYVASELMSRTTPVTWASYLLLPHIPEAGELSIFYASVLGAVLGFLWFNCYPAQTFMGDCGSLPLGAAMGYGALVTRHEILLLIIGGVFVIELMSVVLQVGYFRVHGRQAAFPLRPIAPPLPPGRLERAAGGRTLLAPGGRLRSPGPGDNQAAVKIPPGGGNDFIIPLFQATPRRSVPGRCSRGAGSCGGTGGRRPGLSWHERPRRGWDRPSRPRAGRPRWRRRSPPHRRHG
jgi:phospho-N-acetylmuramoyl-pentapeptide-transferase